jgi:hypothetical protein
MMMILLRLPVVLLLLLLRLVLRMVVMMDSTRFTIIVVVGDVDLAATSEEVEVVHVVLESSEVGVVGVEKDVVADEAMDHSVVKAEDVAAVAVLEVDGVRARRAYSPLDSQGMHEV